MKNHLTAIYPYIRAENTCSSTDCRSIHRVFCKIFDIAVFCFIWISPVNCESKKKIYNSFAGLNVFFKTLNFRSWQVSQSFDSWLYSIKICYSNCTFALAFPIPKTLVDHLYKIYMLQTLFVRKNHITIPMVACFNDASWCLFLQNYRPPVSPPDCCLYWKLGHGDVYYTRSIPNAYTYLMQEPYTLAFIFPLHMAAIVFAFFFSFRCHARQCLFLTTWKHKKEMLYKTWHIHSALIDRI